MAVVLMSKAELSRVDTLARVGRGELPVAESIARSTLALPFHTRLAREDQEYVAEAVADVVGRLAS